jgi:hypothetical protein
MLIPKLGIPRRRLVAWRVPWSPWTLPG